MQQLDPFSDTFKQFREYLPGFNGHGISWDSRHDTNVKYQSIERKLITWIKRACFYFLFIIVIVVVAAAVVGFPLVLFTFLFTFISFLRLRLQ